MTKQKVIQEAYGEYFSEKVNEDGWIKFSMNLPNKIGNWLLSNKDSFFDIEEHTSCVWFRPKSLQGIENNNGWIKIGSSSDLPADSCECNVIWKDGNDREHRAGYSSRLYFNIGMKSMWLKNISHYQPIQKLKPPIY